MAEWTICFTQNCNSRKRKSEEEERCWINEKDFDFYLLPSTECKVD
jgi:patatin-like phospholipase/acyl hydrolase